MELFHVIPPFNFELSMDANLPKVLPNNISSNQRAESIWVRGTIPPATQA
jgi:hypothetical protein